MSVQSVALASLYATYTDSEGEDGVEDERLQEENSNTPQGAAPHNAQVGRQPQVRSGTSPISGGRSASHSPVIGKSAGSSDLPGAATKVQRLVSYFDDTVVSEDDEGATVAALPPPSPSPPAPAPAPSLMTASATIAATVAEGRPEENGLPVATNTGTIVAATAVITIGGGGGGAERRSPSSRSGELLSDNNGETKDSYGVTIPPEPSGQCPAELQDKITKLYRKMESDGLDMNTLIQQRKEFRNPSIYEKLIQFCSINELGTNYPPDRFDPFKWNKDSYYEELAKVQKTEMDKLEKARKEKTKIEIVSGTAKRPNSSTGSGAEESLRTDDAKKRKSKWDQVASGGAAAAAAVAAAAAAAATAKPTVLLAQPTLTTLASSGTKPTIISAFGSLPKKRL